MDAEKYKEEIDKALLEFGVTKEPFQENAAEELKTVLQDYHALAKQYKSMFKKHCHEEKPVKKHDIWCCPACGRRTYYNHSYCHYCGKKLGWR